MSGLASVVLAAVAGAGAARQTEDAFSCQVIATCDPSFEDRWNLLRTGPFQVIAAARVFRGETVRLPILFRGVQADEGRGDVRYDLAILRPDGELHGAFADQVGVAEQHFGAGATLLAEDWLALSFDPDDPPGEYVVSVRARDRRADVRAEAETHLTLVEYAPGAPFEDLDAVWAWAAGTFETPEPERVLGALEAFCAAGGIGAGLPSETIEGYLLERLERDAWLLEIWLGDWEHRDAAARETTLWVLAHAAFDDSALLQRLPAEDRERRAALARERHDPLLDPLDRREDLGELWGRYLASRRMDPLLRLVLALAPDGGVVADASFHDDASGIDVPLERVFAGATPTHLARILAWDPIARGYAETLAGMGQLPEGVGAALAKLLEE
jgi:hypothetical protein